jgi:hypothetical protein
MIRSSGERATVASDHPEGAVHQPLHYETYAIAYLVLLDVALAVLAFTTGG